MAWITPAPAVAAGGDDHAVIKTTLEPNRLEAGAVPILMGDSDLGFGVGGVASVARFSSGYDPFRWQLLAVVFLTVKENGDGTEIAYQDHRLRLDLPGLLDGRVRLRTDLGFCRQQNAGYYGLGNASEAPVSEDPRRHQYDRIYPSLDARAQVKLTDPISLMVGTSLVYNRLEVYEDSKLAEDLQAEDPVLRSMLRGAGNHFSGLIELGLLWDTRNHDLVPSEGDFHELSGRFTPNLLSDLAFGGATLALRFYRSLYHDRLVLAVRILGDLLFGDPPFYELARHGGLFPMPAPGGGSGIRGVPVHRYHGTMKLLSNWEIRGRILPFTWFGQRFNIGAIAFFDAGRIWTARGSLPRFDGSDLGLKIGLGSGLRLQWGEAFLLRVDLAWSPDADPLGFYFNVNHVF